MKKRLEGVQNYLDSLPLWLLLVANAALLAFVFFDLRFPDMLPALDELLALAVFGGSAIYMWNRIFGGPRTPGAREVRRIMKEIERLDSELRKVGKKIKSADVSAQIRGMSELLPKARDVAQRLLALEVILSRPEYQESKALANVNRLVKELENADDAVKPELQKALDGAKDHLANLHIVRTKGATMRASLEHVRQLFLRAESKVLAATIDEAGATAGLAATVQELQGVLDELEAAREEVASATRGGSTEFARKAQQAAGKKITH